MMFNRRSSLVSRDRAVDLLAQRRAELHEDLRDYFGTGRRCVRGAVAGQSGIGDSIFLRFVQIRVWLI